MKILEWFAQDRGVGLSSKAIALTALGVLPEQPNYPHDGSDFGRCIRLIELCPDAQDGLDRLGREGGLVWQALVPRWEEIKDAYLHDMKLHEQGDRNYNKYKCYDLMQSIIRPVEDAGRGFTVYSGKK